MPRTPTSLMQRRRAFNLLGVLLQLAISSVVAFLSHPFNRHSRIPSSPNRPTPRRQLSPFVWTTVLKPPKKYKRTSGYPPRQDKTIIEEYDLKHKNSTSGNHSSSDQDEPLVESSLDSNITMEEIDYRDIWEVTSSSVAKLGNTSSMIPPFRGINLSMYSTNFPAFSFDSWKNSTYLPQSSIAEGIYNGSVAKGFYKRARYNQDNSESFPQPKKNYKSKRKSENLNLPPTLTGKIEANDTLTLSDLTEIIQYNGFVRKEDLGVERFGRSAYQEKTRSKEVPVVLGGSSSSSLETTKRRTDEGVAFPQPSILSYSSLRRGTTVACGTYGIIIASTILPNLWLMGVVLGSFYGYAISNFDEDDEEASLPDKVVPKFCLESGRRLAKTTLDLYDKWQGLWFLYKTGQLSYEYYKRYEVLDQRFAIQDKMDAWNARFQEGKVKFDEWEKENEVGRTILAGLRTVWLVDEQAKRRAKQTSRYRAVQYLYDVKFYIGRGWTRLVSIIRTSNSKFWGEFVNGIREDMKISGLDALGTRIGAVVASLLAINAMGALYAISAPLLTVLAVVLGIIWPSWVPELAARLQDQIDETRARGRGDEDYVSSRTSSINMARVLGRYDKKKYHYYKRSDGSKKYYRTGQSYFRFGTKENEERLAFPWKRKRANKKQPPIHPWGIFGSSSKNSG